jgi:hypothetical protein
MWGGEYISRSSCQNIQVWSSYYVLCDHSCLFTCCHFHAVGIWYLGQGRNPPILCVSLKCTRECKRKAWNVVVTLVLPWTYLHSYLLQCLKIMGMAILGVHRLIVAVPIYWGCLMSLHINKSAVSSSHQKTGGCWCLYSFGSYKMIKFVCVGAFYFHGKKSFG